MLQDKFALLAHKDEDSLDVINNSLTNVISESALAVAGTQPSKETGKLSQETNDLIKKRRNLKITNSRNKVEFSEVTKLITRKKVSDIRAFNMGQILRNARARR